MDNVLLVSFTFTFSPQIFIRTCELVVFHDNTDTNPKCAAARAISLVLRRFYCLALLINVQLCKAGMNAGWVEIFRKSEFERLYIHVYSSIYNYVWNFLIYSNVFRCKVFVLSQTNMFAHFFQTKGIENWWGIVFFKLCKLFLTSFRCNKKMRWCCLRTVVGVWARHECHPEDQTILDIWSNHCIFAPSRVILWHLSLILDIRVEPPVNWKIVLSLLWCLRILNQQGLFAFESVSAYVFLPEDGETGGVWGNSEIKMNVLFSILWPFSKLL